MKRSEMLDILKKLLDSELGYGEYGDWAAEEVLNKIETTGMLPPYNPDKYADYNIMHGYDKLKYCKWDEE